MCFGGRNDVDAKRSREIDALIHRDEKASTKVVKLLLLGKQCASPNRTTDPRLTGRVRRRWREWKIHDFKADAIDLHQEWILQEREGGMASHHLPQYPRRSANDH